MLDAISMDTRYSCTLNNRQAYRSFGTAILGFCIDYSLAYAKQSNETTIHGSYALIVARPDNTLIGGILWRDSRL